MQPSKSKLTVFRQICKLIPGHLVSKLARRHGIDKQLRTFTPWSHVTAHLFAQFSHSISLNDVCDCLQNHEDALKDVRNATPPKRNTFSHANKIRSSEMAKELFWEVFNDINQKWPGFGYRHGLKGLPYRFRRTIYAVDSTTIQLFANCMDWAKHRRQKVAAKMHLSLNLQTFLPDFVVFEPARQSDSKKAREVCSKLKDGEIVVFDKAYYDFAHLFDLYKRGVCFVMRPRENMQFEIMGQHTQPKGNILADWTIKLTKPSSKKKYPETLRFVCAELIVDNKKKIMCFITNNFDWAPSSICDLYKSRWLIEEFFKQMKQTVGLSCFLGYSRNCIEWQVYMALLAYVLLRLLAYLNEWRFSFRRFYTLLGGVLLSRLDLSSVIQRCGTAGNPKRIRAHPVQAYFAF